MISTNRNVSYRRSLRLIYFCSSNFKVDDDNRFNLTKCWLVCIQDQSMNVNSIKVIRKLIDRYRSHLVTFGTFRCLISLATCAPLKSQFERFKSPVSRWHFTLSRSNNEMEHFDFLFHFPFHCERCPLQCALQRASNIILGRFYLGVRPVPSVHYAKCPAYYADGPSLEVDFFLAGPWIAIDFQWRFSSSSAGGRGLLTIFIYPGQKRERRD